MALSAASPISSSVLVVPAMTASGVRRSCDTELSSELRIRSVSASTRAQRRCSASSSRSMAMPICRPPSRAAAGSRGQEEAGAAGGSTASTPTVACGVDQGQVDGAGRRGGCRCRCPAICPCSNAHVATATSMRRRRPARRRGHHRLEDGAVRQVDAHRPAEDGGHLPLGRDGQLVGPGDARQAPG